MICRPISYEYVKILNLVLQITCRLFSRLPQTYPLLNFPDIQYKIRHACIYIQYTLPRMQEIMYMYTYASFIPSQGPSRVALQAKKRIVRSHTFSYISC